MKRGGGTGGGLGIIISLEKDNNMVSRKSGKFQLKKVNSLIEKTFRS